MASFKPLFWPGRAAACRGGDDSRWEKASAMLACRDVEELLSREWASK